MIKLGLTGGIASGKGTVATIFKALGAEIIDADRIAHAVILKGRPAYRKIVNRFGPAILKENGEIDRTSLGRRVFSDPGQLEELNRIVHPEVFREKKKEEEKIRRIHPDALVVYDIPLLIESGAHLKMDKIVVVYARQKTRLARLLLRSGLTREEGIRRIRSQMPLSQKLKFADYRINGEGDRKKLREKLKKIVREINASRKIKGTRAKKEERPG